MNWIEADRLAALDKYQILDTPPDPDFDDVVQLVAQALEAPIVVINLIARDRQWFKAEIGIGTREMPLDVSICAHAILQDDLLVVPDTRRDPRFAQNPLVTSENGLRFYAGALLKTPEGLPIGTVCALDRAPRPQGITHFQRLTLEVLAKQVMSQIELRRALTWQREDERRNRLILESAVDYAIITLDLEGNISSWNAGATRLLGWEAGEILGRSYDLFLQAEDVHEGDVAQELATARVRRGAREERWHHRKDGSRFWASGELMPLTDDDGSTIGFLKIMRDLTRQYSDRKALEESEFRTRLALDAAELGTWESTPSLEALTWDARARELLGHSSDEPIDYHRSFLARVHPLDRDRVAEAITATLAADGAEALDIEYRTISAVDGKERWVHAIGALAVRQDGISKFVGTVRDVSARKKSEEDRRLLTEELNHRIKNTLAVVQSIVSQSLRNSATKDEAGQAIGERLVALGAAHDLLTHSSWTEACLRDVAQRATELHAAGSDRVGIEGPPIRLCAKSALAFAMTFHELATNAVKYGSLSNADGRVQLSWTLVDNRLDVRWQETGGPAVTAPERGGGFGSRLIKSLKRDLGGDSTMHYDETGFVWTLAASLAAIAP